MKRLGITALVVTCLALTADAFASDSVLVEPTASGDTFRSCSIPHTPMKMPKRLKGSRGCGCQTSDPAGFAGIALVLAVGLSGRRRPRSPAR